MEVIRGNKTLSGTWGELWINGEKIFEFSKSTVYKGLHRVTV